MRTFVYGLILIFSTMGCAARSVAPFSAARDGDVTWGEAERVATMSQYVERLPVGGRVRVQTVDGARWSATLLSADRERVVLQPRGRLTEPARAIPIASLQLIEPESQGGNNQLLKAVAVGVATGAATFVTMLMIALATVD
jgi:hypothetical protein